MWPSLEMARNEGVKILFPEKHKRADRPKSSQPSQKNLAII